MPVIRLSVNQDRIEINPRRIKKAAEEILNGLGFTDTELSIAIVDDGEMAQLNMQYRQVNKPTDVLAFPMLEGEFADVLPELLGDVVISAPTAQLMSRQHHRPLSMVLDLLLVHGILHLLGYDHERGEEEARRMEDRSLGLLKMLGHSEESFDWYMERRDEG
jgi:probable rRNA maturation factor